MDEWNHEQTKVCGRCGNPVIDTGTGGLVHANGGTIMQRCKNCGWTGGQIGRFAECPRCGDATNLLDDHSAS